MHFLATYLASADNIGIAAEHVDDFSLAFISPLRA